MKDKVWADAHSQLPEYSERQPCNGCNKPIGIACLSCKRMGTRKEKRLCKGCGDMVAKGQRHRCNEV